MNDYNHCYLLFNYKYVHKVMYCVSMVSAVTLHWWASQNTIPSGKRNTLHIIRKLNETYL